MAGSLGPGKGSMVNVPEMVQSIKEKRDLELLEQKQDRVAEEKVEAAEKAHEKKVMDLLPEKVNCAFGELPYADFKKKYSDVWEHVALKEHFATGFVTHTGTLPDGTKCVVRTLRKREADVMRSMVPKSTAFSGGTQEAYFQESSIYETTRLILSLMEFGERRFDDILRLSFDTLEEWRKHKEVKARREWLDDLPDDYVAMVMALINDTQQAYQLALAENLKNR